MAANVVAILDVGDDLSGGVSPGRKKVLDILISGHVPSFARAR